MKLKCSRLKGHHLELSAATAMSGHSLKADEERQGSSDALLCVLEHSYTQSGMHTLMDLYNIYRDILKISQKLTTEVSEKCPRHVIVNGRSELPENRFKHRHLLQLLTFGGD